MCQNLMKQSRFYDRNYKLNPMKWWKWCMKLVRDTLKFIWHCMLQFMCVKVCVIVLMMLCVKVQVLRFMWILKFVFECWDPCTCVFRVMWLWVKWKIYSKIKKKERERKKKTAKKERFRSKFTNILYTKCQINLKCKQTAPELTKPNCWCLTFIQGFFPLYQYL